ncbi:hypothetical protein [Streptomyces sp. NBC_00503]|uniref:hypothetical protein n=1 Tax=Streptomyces sp. NBC_00503 TaxID=2903659 RepID=UPI002E802450|nr:hypothetical protein [Streptomyces sp. NBC_00503]WUD81021.1 hypothetical protein OG490_10940 [Streptomyces sp. NBC_00503]
MTGSAGSAPAVSGGPQSKSTGRVGAAVCATVLVLGHLVTCYFVLTAYMVEPDGPWDRQAVTNCGVAAGAALCCTVVTTLLSWLFVKVGWLRRWWFALPALWAVAAVLRLTLLGPQL